MNESRMPSYVLKIFKCATLGFICPHFSPKIKSRKKLFGRHVFFFILSKFQQPPPSPPPPPLSNPPPPPPEVPPVPP